MRYRYRTRGREAAEAIGEEGFGRGAWRMGPTRLLLLDESYAERRVDDLPEAVKVLISSGALSVVSVL